MNIDFIIVGKTTEEYLKYGENVYLKRLKHYIKINIIEIPRVKKSKNMPVSDQKRLEGIQIEKHIGNSDYVILLDEKGEQLSSEEFANELENFMNRGIKKSTFVIGGAYGFNKDLKSRADMILSLSKMTFSHQMVRLFFLEQLYRAFTIIRGESYHNP